MISAWTPVAALWALIVATIVAGLSPVLNVRVLDPMAPLIVICTGPLAIVVTGWSPTTAARLGAWVTLIW